MTSPLLDPAAIDRAEALGLFAAGVVDGYMAGDHRSPMRGFSIEFTEHREYVPGDDPRRLDWKVLGRTDRLMLKQYEQETNVVCHVLLDGSGSMAYRSADGPAAKGHPPAALSKFDYGRTLAACLAYLVLRQRDAVSVAVFDTALRDVVPRTGNLASLGTILGTLAAAKPAQRTGIGTVLRAFAAPLRKRGIVLVVSDLFDDEPPVLAALDRLRFAGHEVVLFHTLDPYEVTFPFAGNVEFDDLEPPGSPDAGPLRTTPREVRQSYLDQMTAFRDRLRLGCQRNGTHLVAVNTGEPLADVLGNYLAARHR